MHYMRFQNTKRIGSWSLWVSLLGICCVLFTACAGAATSQSKQQPAIATPISTSTIPVLTAHVLTVGSYMLYPPQEFLEGSTPTGFDIDLIKAIAQHMGLQTRIMAKNFPTLIDDLAAGQFDVVISAVSITPENEKKVAFVPYFKGGESLLVALGNPERIQNLDDLCGKTVGVKDATFEQSDLVAVNTSCQDKSKPAIQLTIVKKQSDLIQLLISKHVVAIYQDAPVTDYYLKKYAGQFEQAGQVIDVNLEGIAVRKENQELFRLIQEALEALKTNGVYHNLVLKWGLKSGDITIKG